MQKKQKILFLCTGNSYRSQMAEALCRHLRNDLYEVYSAGIEQHGMNPYAVTVLEELGLDLSRQRSKTLDQLGEVRFDQVITVCAHADQSCPDFGEHTQVVHVGFEDPPSLTRSLSDEKEILPIFRRVRDEIRDFVLSLAQALEPVAARSLG